MEQKQIPQEIQELFSAYAAIPIPYYIHTGMKQPFAGRVMKGKGSIDEITKRLYLIKKSGEFTGLSDKEILEKANIGIDCSGFVAWLYEAYSTKHLNKHIWELYKRPTYNPINWLLFHIDPVESMLNADTLTSLVNCEAIEKVKDIRVMDLVRLNGGRHVVMIYKIYYKDGIVGALDYIHSTSGVGVCMGKIMVNDPEQSIVQATWVKLEGNPKYQPADLINRHVNDNGIRRPHFLA
jgi:hypothetical protein